MAIEWTHIRVPAALKANLEQLRREWARLEAQGRSIVEPGRWDEVTLAGVIRTLLERWQQHRQAARRQRARAKAARVRRAAEDCGLNP